MNPGSDQIQIGRQEQKAVHPQNISRIPADSRHSIARYHNDQICIEIYNHQILQMNGKLFHILLHLPQIQIRHFLRELRPAKFRIHHIRRCYRQDPECGSMHLFES